MADLQSSGTSHIFKDYSIICFSGVQILERTSYSTLGCIESGPGDLFNFKLDNFL